MKPMLQYWRVVALALAIMAVGAYQLYGVFSNRGYQPAQPIAFSHVLHAGVMKMECLYCHFEAERGPHAGVPSLDVCMGCHSVVQTSSPEIQKLQQYYEQGLPVPWVRIHSLPDHAYFSHRWHVAAGVECQTCHGPIETMPVVGQWKKLEMADCMECHKSDEYVAPSDKVPGIVRYPTYHEAPVTQADVVEVRSEAAAAGEGDMVSSTWLSARDRFLSLHGETLTAQEQEVIRARLSEYRKDHYLHGRGAQLRGKNASIECSTCHN